MLNAFLVVPKDRPQKAFGLDPELLAAGIGRRGSLTRSVRLLLPILFCLVTDSAICQAPGDTLNHARTTVFVSALGNGGLYSVNWDRRWPVGTKKWMSVSGGFTYFRYPGSDSPTNVSQISLPVQWNWFKGQVHHREHGAGLTFGRGWFTGSTYFGERLVSNGIYLFAKPFGYRYQLDLGGFFFRAYALAWVRIIELNRRYVEEYGFWETPPVFPWVGFDLGYTFRHHQNLNRS